MTVEPRVEDLLATIRKAIDDDMNGLDAAASTSSNAQGTLMRGALREMRVNYETSRPDPLQADREIAELRDRINKSRGTSFPPAPAAPAYTPPRANARAPGRANPLSNPLAHEQPRTAMPVTPPLRLGYDEFPPETEAYAPAYAEPGWPEEEGQQSDYYAAPPAYEAPAYEQPNYDAPVAPIVSPRTAYQAQNSFQHLAESVLARASGDRGLEDMTRELLRGLLKQWLDDNLPQLVEKLVREEIERVARRGR